jgi:hypothetical protein
MNSDAEAQEIHATITDAGHSRDPADGYQAQRPNGASDEETIDPDAVVIAEVEEESVVPADDETAGPADDETAGPADDETAGPADDETAGPADDETAVPADDEVLSPAVEESDTGPVPVVPAAATIPDAARPGMPADTSGPADTDMVGDPERLHEQFAAIQSTFVDDPRGSVAAAAELVSETMTALVAAAKERERGLRGEWDRDGVDTEGLRNALRSYRGLLDRLVRL